jgi:ribosome biogenesis GTPase A
VIPGAFKRGKSTLINALLGEPVLPTAMVPLTSVVTILGYGESLDIQVHFQNGRSQKITQPELADYITEKGNPRNQKGVREVEIAYPYDYLRDGVRIIDTPGVGSVYSHNTEVAYNYLPQVEAAVFDPHPGTGQGPEAGERPDGVAPGRRGGVEIDRNPAGRRLVIGVKDPH